MAAGTIIDLKGTYTYNTSKFIANYLERLPKNQYTISDILKFPDLLKSADTNANYEDVSYDVESLFTSIPVAETIEYIMKHIYTNKELNLYVKSLFLKNICYYFIIGDMQSEIWCRCLFSTTKLCITGETSLTL